MRLAFYGLIALALLATLSLIARAIYNAGAAKCELRHEQAAAAQREKEQQQAHTAGSILEAEDGKAKVVYRSITKTVDRFIDRPVYRNTCLDADGLSSVNSALRGPSATAGEFDKSLSRPDTVGGRDGRDSAEETDRSK